MHGLPSLQEGTGARSSRVNQSSEDYVDSVYERYTYRLPEEASGTIYDPTDPRYRDGTYLGNTPFVTPFTTPNGEYIPTPTPGRATLPIVTEFPALLADKGFSWQQWSYTHVIAVCLDLFS